MALIESIAPSPPRAWLATAWAGQKPAASGASLVAPAQEAEQLADIAGCPRRAPAPPAPLVAVEQARGEGVAPGVDGGQGGDHGHDVDPDGVQAGGDLPPGLAHALPPGPVGVVLEAVGGRDADRVGHPDLGQHVTVVVHGQALDRGRADVQARP